MKHSATCLFTSVVSDTPPGTYCVCQRTPARRSEPATDLDIFSRRAISILPIALIAFGVTVLSIAWGLNR